RISRAELKAISEDPLKPMLNRVMNENYHPGSTFKTIISFAGLESSAITAGSTVFCGGGYTMGNHRWRCDKAQGHGLLDMKHALAYAAVANGGDIVLPQIVRRIEAPDGKVIREFQPQVLRKLGLKESSLAAVRGALRAVVNEPGGTAYRSRLQEIEFAGKTGTAQVMKLGQKQKLDPTTQAYFSRDHAWFA